MSSARIRVGLVGLDHWYTAIPLAEEIAKKRGNDARRYLRRRWCARDRGGPALRGGPGGDRVASSG